MMRPSASITTVRNPNGKMGAWNASSVDSIATTPETLGAADFAPSSDVAGWYVGLATMSTNSPVVAERTTSGATLWRSEEHTSELQSHHDLVCRLLLEKKKKTHI